MKTITIKMGDLTEEKRKELQELYPFDDTLQPDDIITFIKIYDKDDLDLDIEKARIELELDNPEVH